MEYECPKCRNTEHPIGSNFCKICGKKIEMKRMENNSKSPQAVRATSEEIEHDYKYLQSILSNYDIGRLKYAISIGKPIFVDGIQGPTGKSALVRYLRERGVHAIGFWEVEGFTLNEFLKEKKSKPFNEFVF